MFVFNEVNEDTIKRVIDGLTRQNGKEESRE